MTVLVACETLLLVALTFLVVGLLRSHAEILRRLGPARTEGSRPGEDLPVGDSLPQPQRRADQRAGRDIAGLTPSRDALKVALGVESPPTLLAFLSSGCNVCTRVWKDLGSAPRPMELPDDVRLVAVTKGLHEESPSRIRELAAETLPVVMSSEAWLDYGVPAAPFFVYVRHGRIHGEGSASTWAGIASLLRDAIEDHAYESNGQRRTTEIDRVLTAAGIGPGHPSLYPAGVAGKARAEPPSQGETR